MFYSKGERELPLIELSEDGVDLANDSFQMCSELLLAMYTLVE